MDTTIQEAYERTILEQVKVRSAVNTKVKGVVVGITPNNKVIIFKKEDYDSKGNVTGKTKDITKIAGENGFYLLSGDYSPKAMKKLGFTDEVKNKLMDIAKKFS